MKNRLFFYIIDTYGISNHTMHLPTAVLPAIIAKYGVPIREWWLLYQALLRCLWTKCIVNSVRVDGWTPTLAIIGSNELLSLDLSLV